jgi:hypothetical protein
MQRYYDQDGHEYDGPEHESDYEIDEPDPCDDCGLTQCECPTFADPGGRSALRAAGPGNPRNLPCPTCGAPDRLTPKDRELGYQCNACADSAEGWGP